MILANGGIAFSILTSYSGRSFSTVPVKTEKIFRLNFTSTSYQGSWPRASIPGMRGGGGGVFPTLLQSEEVVKRLAACEAANDTCFMQQVGLTSFFD